MEFNKIFNEELGTARSKKLKIHLTSHIKEKVYLTSHIKHFFEKTRPFAYSLKQRIEPKLEIMVKNFDRCFWMGSTNSVSNRGQWMISKLLRLLIERLVFIFNTRLIPFSIGFLVIRYSYQLEHQEDKSFLCFMNHLILKQPEFFIKLMSLARNLAMLLMCTWVESLLIL